MQKKIEEHQFTGMQRDMSISKQKPEYLWDAHNIRLTARHGETLLSMSNERGTKSISDVTFTGVVLGYCVLGNYLTVFTVDVNAQTNRDYIYRVEKTSSGFITTRLYNGNLNFKVNKPIECLGVYENEKILKVYWTDGENQPRFINIVKDRLVTNLNYTNTSFDFIPTLALNDSISVRKVPDSSGLFPAGVIQYAVTYYNKYEQESNISVVSPLIPTSYTQRAGSPEETIGNAFKVTVTNPDKQFEYMRIYSIFRSSKDTTPVCKRVVDVKLGEGAGASSTSKVFVTPDPENILTARYQLSGAMVQLNPQSAFVYLTDQDDHIGDEDITLPWNQVLRAGKYYHFSKQLFPYLVIKAREHDSYWEDHNNTHMYFTWGDSCTDIYLSFDPDPDEVIVGPGKDTWPLMVGANGDALATGYILMTGEGHYEDIYTVNDDAVTITDNNTIGEEIDYNELLFVGGEEITAGTITQKDGTMFLGDIRIKRPQITGDYTEGNNSENNIVKLIRDNTQINTNHRTCVLPDTMNSQYYKWYNTLNATTSAGESTNIAGFKWRDHYRLGLQFQYKTGKWSQPVFIKDWTTGDVVNNNVITIDNSHKPSLNINDHQQTVPTFKAVINQTIGEKMAALGYQRVRAVVCFPTESDQLILCQGLINPTVHSIANRINHTPDVQSSWYFRPVPAGNEEAELDSYGGGIVQYRHGHTLYSGNGNEDPVVPTRGDEIQGVPVRFSDQDYHEYMADDYESIELPDEVVVAVPGQYSNQPRLRYSPHIPNPLDEDQSHADWIYYDKNDLTNVFVVDWNYLTFHSPEFEFNDSFANIDTEALHCRKIGKYKLFSNLGDIHITTSSSTMATDRPGFCHRIVSSLNAYRINAGLFYKDCWIVVNKDNEYGPIYNLKDETSKPQDCAFLIYPWHRFGSLNNDCVRSMDSTGAAGKRTAMLDQKKISNIMVFDDLAALTYEDLNADIKIFNSDQIALAKINGKNYFGNIDQVISSHFRYPIAWTASELFAARIGFYPTIDWLSSGGPEKVKGAGLLISNDPVYMKYKSTPHAVLHTEFEFDLSRNNTYPYLYCVEMYREPNASTDFGGTSPMAIHNNLWYPAGPVVRINAGGNTEIDYMYGDTYYQRYDCLKTYPFTDEDTNSIIEIGSFMVETRINLDGRYDKNRGNIQNFMLNPTVFNLINPVYSQKDNFFNYRILDEDYYALSDYPTMVTWTGYKNNAAEVDNWTNITLASTLEMDGTKGRVNAVRVNSDQLYCFQDDAIGQILFNSRVQISPSDGVPIEISNNYKVDGNRYITTSIGCQNKWSIAEGIEGLYFIDNNTEALYLLSGQSQLKPVSTPLQMSYWFMMQDCGTHWRQHYYSNGDTQQISLPHEQQGIRCFYDSANADLYICTPEETLCYSEKLGQFISFFDYHNVIGMFNIDSEYYALNYPDNNTSDIKLWGMFQGVYNSFFDKTYLSDFTFISNENPLNDKIFTNIEVRGDFRFWARNEIGDDFNSPDHVVDHRRMFDTVRVWNEYQDTGDIDLRFLNDTVSNMKKKFRIWRTDIPRDKNHIRQRIRNTWSKVKLVMNTLPEYTIEDIYNGAYTEFATYNLATQTWEDVNFKDRMIDGTMHYFTIGENSSNQTVIVEHHKINGPHDTLIPVVDANYFLEGNRILKTTLNESPSHQLFEVYAYRKIHDMEIHDVGVVYFV